LITDEEAEALGHKQLFVVHLERKQVGITHDGVQVAQDEAKIGSFYVGANMDRPHLIEQALRAHVVYERDKDYVVQNREIIIVDEFTGRLMVGRQWSDGLHQAVEAKESVPVKEETQTMATITIQNFLKLYAERAGMTGTAMTEADEFMKIYKLDCMEIPTNRPVNRLDHNDKIYRSVQQKYHAIVEEIHEIRRKGRPNDPFLLIDALKALKPIKERMGESVENIEEAIRQFNAAEFGDKKVMNFIMQTYDEAVGDLATGRPVLVGTTSVENSEKLSRLLDSTFGIEHEVLNAKNHAREAEIVAKAGHRTLPTRGEKTPLGNVTVATNMAGRGTDIKLEAGVVYPKCKVPLDGTSDISGNGEASNALYPPGATKCCIHCDEYNPSTRCAHCFKPQIDPRFPELGRKVCSLNSPCGLHIIGTERHEARRIDNQLRGRAGRQGDPGSSRFFLSLEDDLLKLFMPDWMLKMMEKLGFTDGTSLEDKRLNKGIQRAQRKVEERNFGIRKNLLEWDEPIDYQRREFYHERQRILDGIDLRGAVLDTITASIAENVELFLARDYRAKCIAEWCRANLDLAIAPEKIRGDELVEIQDQVRQHAIDESRELIHTTVGEYIDVEAPAAEWDVRGLVDWAQRSFEASITQNQVRKMEPDEITEWLVEAAEKHFTDVDLEPIAIYLGEDYPLLMLGDWVRSKFGLEVRVEEMREKTAPTITEFVTERVADLYRQREISYPVEAAIERAGALQPGVDNAYVAAAIAEWTTRKYGVPRRPEEFQNRDPQDIYKELFAINEEYLTNGKLDAEIDKALSARSEDEAIAWAKERFGPAWNPYSFRNQEGELADKLRGQGRELLRYELSRLEQAVLLRIHDQCWKDHLLEMDHLKHAIMQRPMGGDQTHPQSRYAIEGREFFDQMWTRIRDRITDVILKVRLGGGPSGQAPEMPDQQQRLQMAHGDATGAGFAAAAAASEADQRAAMRAQGVDQKAETIRREQPRVGRNDPCPCGSGKKYKQCHGRQ
ncbi:MAG TPA: SEC-C metal-binding domain-containing protein, partial [Phycisphaerae bacterium]|nr:SEC-C metal-binding domain-containing protein [Phycisphaerae bacterium]